MGDDSVFEEHLGAVVGRGAQATVYARGEYAVKLYRENYPKGNVFGEAFVMSILEQLDFPSPRVHEVLLLNGRYGIRMDRVRGKSLVDMIADPVDGEKAFADLIELQCRLHRSDSSVGAAIPNLKLRWQNDLQRNEHLSAALKKKLLELLGKLPDGESLCHCDFHSGNVFYDDGKYTIIDLLQMSRGDPAADIACSYTSYAFVNQELAEYYLRRMCEKAGIREDDVRQWLAVYAGTVAGQVPDEFMTVVNRLLAPVREAAE